MAKFNVSLPLFCLFLLFSSSGGILKFADGQGTPQPSWCVAKASTSSEMLEENIQYACSNMNCDKIRPGGSCFNPDDPLNHASVVMNMFYQNAGRNFYDCNFKDTGVITVTDPSYGDCRYEYTG